MARRKMETLRDSVIAAASAVTTRHDSNQVYGLEMLAMMDAVRALNALITPIIDSPGEYVEGSPETSKEAALLASPLAGSVRRQIVDEIFSTQYWSGRGLTDADLEHRLKGRHQTISAARNWLVEAGWVTDSQLRKVTPGTGRRAVLWVLTRQAMDQMKAQAA